MIRTLLMLLFFVSFAYAVIGVGFWWTWHSGTYNDHLLGLPDDFSTFILVLTRWPMFVI